VQGKMMIKAPRVNIRGRTFTTNPAASVQISPPGLGTAAFGWMIAATAASMQQQ